MMTASGFTTRFFRSTSNSAVDAVAGLNPGPKSTKSTRKKPSSKYAALEPRVMFDAAAEQTIAAVMDAVVIEHSLFSDTQDQATNGAIVAGLVSDRESSRLKIGAKASFIAETGLGYAIDATMIGAGLPGGEGIEFGYLSSDHGGAIAVAHPTNGGIAQPVSGVLPVRFSVEGTAPAKAQRGTLTAQATPTSFLTLAFGRVVSVFLRESGF